MTYDQYRNGMAIVSNDPEIFICCICPEKSKESLEDHLKLEAHRLRLAYFSLCFEDNGNSARCKTCSEWLSLDKVLEHANNDEHIPWFRSKYEIELLSKNFITFRKSHYYCLLCNSKFLEWFSVICHIQTSNHKCYLNGMIDESLTEQSSLLLSFCAVTQSVFRNKTKTLACFLCKCEIEASIECLIIHVEDDVHIKKETEFDECVNSENSYKSHLSLHITNFNEKIRNLSHSEADLRIVKNDNEDFLVHSKSIIKKIAHESKELLKNGVVNDNSNFMGSDNNISVLENDIQTNILSSTKSNNENKRKSNNNLDLPLGITNKNGILFCEACSVFFGMYISSVEHANTEHHKTKLEDCENGIVHLEKLRNLCSHSNCIVNGRCDEVEDHLKSSEHILNKTDISIHDQESTFIDETSDSEGSSIYASASSIYSTASSTSLNTSVCQPNQAPSNNNSIMSNTSAESFPEETVIEKTSTESTEIEPLPSVEISFTKCDICHWVILNDSSNILLHATSQVHIEKLQALLSVYSEKILIDATFTNFNHARYFKIESNVESDANVIKVLMVPLTNKNNMKQFYWCNICEAMLKDLPSIHLQSLSHLQILHERNPKETRESERNSTSINFESIKSCFPEDSIQDGIETITGESFYLCTICNCRIDGLENAENHAKAIYHNNNVKKNFVIKIRETIFACFICLNLFHNLTSLEEHLSSLSHQEKCKGMKDSELASVGAELISSIQQYEQNQYICSICHLEIEGDLITPLEHSLSQIHQSMLIESSLSATQSSTDHQSLASNHQVNESPKNPRCTNEVYGRAKAYIADRNFSKRLPEGIEYYSTKYLLCTICNCKLSKGKSIDAHIATIGHVTRAASGPAVIRRIGNEDFECIACNSRVRSTGLIEHLMNINHALNKAKFVADLKSREQPEPTRKPRMISTFRPRDDAATSSDLIKPVEVVPLPLTNTKQSVCNICNLIIPGGDWNLMAHRNTEQHKKNEAMNFCSFSPVNQTVKLESDNNQPSLLSMNIPGEAIMQIHFKGVSMDSIECTICKVHIRASQYFSVYDNYAKHMASEEHKVYEVDFVKNWKPSSLSKETTSIKTSKNSKRRSKVAKKVKMTDKQTFLCSFCGIEINFVYDLHAHLTSHFWIRYVPDSSIENEEISGEKQQLLESTRQINSNMLTLQEQPSDILDDLEFISKPEKSPKKPQFSNWRKKPLDIDINDGVDIYKVHAQKKEDFQLGVILSFAIDRENLYCLVCRKTIRNTPQNFYEHLCSIIHLNYLQQIIEDHRTFKDYPGEFSDLTLGHEYMEEMDDVSVKCHACGTSLPNDSSALNEHIKDVSHSERWSSLAENTKTLFNMLLSKMHCDFYSVKNYTCVPCKSKFSVEIEFRRHLYSRKHRTKIQKFKNSGEELIFDHCAICAGLWFGFLKTFGYHSKCKMHKHYVSQNGFLSTTLPLSAERLLHSPEQIASRLLKKIDSVRTDNAEKEKKLMHDLEVICKENNQNCIARPFGSRITKLGGTSSDLDIFLDFSTKKYPVYEGKNSPIKKVIERLEAIKICLMKDSKNWTIDREILDARIPIMKVSHWPTTIQCDISVVNGLTVENTKLIKSFCDKFPNCRKLIIFIKNWMGHCDLTGLHGINSYGIAWMVIFFLQLKGNLPSIAELIDKKRQSRLIGGWETGVDFEFEVIDIGERFEKLLFDFFAFYANFDYRNEVICPLLGLSVKKIDFQKRTRLPPEMKPYLSYLESNDNPEPFRIDSILCIQDPFDLSHNIAKAVKKISIYRLKLFCISSAEILKDS